MSVVKTSVNLTTEAVETLKQLADKSGSSMAEVLRKAISTEKFLQDTTEQGGKILIQNKDKSIREILIRR